MQSPSPVQLSIVSPVYGCTACLQQLCRRIVASVSPLGISFEIILVDDRGPDNAWPEILKLGEEFPEHLRAIRLSRNFGQQMAITAGLAECRGAAAIVLDCDLQEPPEEIPRLYNKHLEGYQVVLTRRIAKKHSAFKRITSVLYTKAMKLATGRTINSEIGGFSLISRPVINAFLQFKEINRHYLYMIQWIGFETATLDFTHQPRAAGQSSYTLVKLLNHALQGLLFHNLRLLKFVPAAGLALISIGGLIALWALSCIWAGQPAPTWAFTLLSIFTIGGSILFVQGLIGIYIEQAFEQLKSRPLYIISDRLNDDSPIMNHKT